MRTICLAIALIAPLLGGPTEPDPADRAAQQAEEQRFSALGTDILRAETTAGPDAVADDANRALAKLHWERAGRMLSGEWAEYGLKVEDELTAGEQALARLGTAERPYADVTGENLTLAYEADNDRSTQPYFLYVPSGYRPEEPTPLVIYLHGWVPGTNKLAPWMIGPSVFPLLDEYGYLFLQPHGRGNTDFQGVGEGDVLRAIDEAARLYSVDPERIYLAGNSMGGYGAYCIGLHQPDRFAALAPACAQSDYYRWYRLQRDQVPPFKRAMYETSNPIDLFPNARNLPVLIQHGERDPIVSSAFARLADAELTRLGYEHQIAIVPDGPHEIYFEDSYFRRLFDFVRDRAQVRLPSHVTWRTYTLDSPGAYWLRVERIEEWGKAADVDAVAEGGTLTVTASHVGRLALRAEDLGALAVEHLWLNGQPAEIPAPGPDGWAAVDLTPAPEGALAKKPGLCGPIRTVFEKPFLCVYGTAAGEGENDPLLVGFTQDWWRFCEGLPLVVPPREGRWSPLWAIPDTAVTEEIERTHNLILFGRPEENSYLARIAEGLPISFLEGGYRLGGQDYVGADLGLWFCYPNPRAPERMVLSVSGQPWGTGFTLVTRFAHRYDLLPDFILFDSGIDPDNTNHYRAAGFFDSNWNLTTVETPPGPEPARAG